MSANLDIKWNGKKFPIEFSSAKELQQTTVRELKNICERFTGVSPSDMKINAFGALMNNDDMPLSIYGLRPGCYVTLKVNKSGHKKNASRDVCNLPWQHCRHNHTHNNKQSTPPLPARPAPSISSPQSPPSSYAPPPAQELEGEALLLEQLRKIQDKIDQNITPQVRKYEKAVKEFLNQSTKTEKEKKKQIYMGAYLGEQLMLVLFDLDGFTCGPNNLDARQARKVAVKSAQSLLDTVDEIKSAVKNVAVIDAEKE
ncbi:hypothetical protein [Parasitella parasitica]|uniref:BAG domain-containing protein n=1 Tax=Parasitella parasitica TaxID=35722 RepID=A0A0B7NNC6_9FUNG|nr:hypothetical protein [Parasitella parasitica]